MTDMSAVARDSERIGRELSDVLTTPGIKPAELQKQLAGLVQQQEIGVDARRELDPPGPLRDSHEAAIESLAVPRRRPRRLAEAFRRTQGSKDAAAAGALLASQAERLVASDVVWDDLFKAPSVDVLQRAGDQRRRGARLELRPDARPREHALDGADLGADQRLGRLGDRHADGLHGTNIESVKVAARRPDALRATENTVEASTDLAFEVTVANARRQPGGQDRGDADDPAEPDADREEADDRHHQPGRDEDRRLPRLPVGRLRRAADHADRRRARARRGEDRQQLRRVPGHLLAGRVARDRRADAVAIAAAAAAAVALGVCFWLWVRVRRLRAAQRVLLGGGRSDLVDFAVSLQGRIDDLHRAVDEIAAGLSRVDRRVDGSLTNTAVVRYDAYAGTGGHQSASFAFLDANRTGTVVTAIQGRDYARLYVKELDRGRAPIALSPEELEAVERAMAR